MTLGAVGDTLGLTSASIYVAALVQFPLSLVFMVHFPPIKADFFATSSRVVIDNLTNTTGVDIHNPTYLHYMHSINIAPLFLLCSALLTFFVTASVYMNKHDHHGQSVEFEDYISNNETVVSNPIVTAWNQSFICLLLVSHALITIIVVSPTSIHFLGLVLLLLYFSLSLVIQPRIQSVGATDGSSSTYITALVAYGIALCLIVSNIVCDDDSLKVELVVLVAFVDVAILIMGHTWDPIPNMQTVINCRLLYCAFLIVLNLMLYATWSPLFKLHFVHT
jgi:hypothetical protein